MNLITEGIKDSICFNCTNWIFNDWYMCDKAPAGKSDTGVLILPITECENFKEELELGKSCDNCKNHCETNVCLSKEWFEPRDITFSILNNLNPTVDSCTKKLIEELGELLQLIGKGHQASGEQIGMMPEKYMPQRMIEEAFDVAQSAVTMIYTIAKEHNIDVDEWLGYHTEKLREKGYLV